MKRKKVILTTLCLGILAFVIIFVNDVNVMKVYTYTDPQMHQMMNKTIVEVKESHFTVVNNITEGEEDYVENSLFWSDRIEHLLPQGRCHDI